MYIGRMNYPPFLLAEEVFRDEGEGRKRGEGAFSWNMMKSRYGIPEQDDAGFLLMAYQPLIQAPAQLCDARHFVAVHWLPL